MIMRNRVLIGVAVGASLLLVPSLAGAQDTEGRSNAALDITKVVEGEVPPGTTFTVEVSCPTIDGGPPTDSTAVDAEDWGGANPEGIPDINETLTFDENGGTQSVEGIFFENRDCTVTETDDGGAESVTYAAGPNEPDGCEVVPAEDSAEANFGDPSTCDVQITNTFPEAQAADVIQDIGPTFTG